MVKDLESIVESVRKNVDLSIRNDLEADCKAYNLDYKSYPINQLLTELSFKSNHNPYYNNLLGKYLKLELAINKLLTTYYTLEEYKLKNLLEDKYFDFNKRGAHPFGKLGFAMGLVVAIPAIVYAISQGNGETMLFVPFSAAAGAMIGEALARYRRLRWNQMNEFFNENVKNILDNLAKSSIKQEKENLIDYLSRLEVYVSLLSQELDLVKEKCKK